MTDNEAPKDGNAIIPTGGPSDTEKLVARHHHKKYFIVGAIGLVAIIIFAIAFPLSRRNGSEDTPEAGPFVNLGLDDSFTDIDQGRIEDSSMDHSTPPESVHETITFVKDPFDVNLNSFSSNITQGYSNIQSFDEDLTAAAMLLVNNAIKRNLRIPGYEHVGFGIGNGMGRFVSFDGAVEPTAMAAPEMALDEASTNGGVTDFETNNQEYGVDEADIIKADENYVYAAYGDYVVVWDPDGKRITQLKMPNNIEEVFNEETIIAAETRMKVREYYIYPRIDSLVLSSGYLVVFVSGYGQALRQQRNEKFILHDYLGTQIRTYRTTTLPVELEFVGMKNVNGRFLDARSVGSNIHLATVSRIDTYNTLIAPLERRAHFSTLSDDEYLFAAKQVAKEEAIPDFVRRLTEELFTSEEEVSNMLQVNRWQGNIPENSQLADVVFGEGVTNNIALVTSFDVTDETHLTEEIAVSTSSFLSPSSWIHMYGTEEKLILATQGWNWNPNTECQEQATYLVGLALDGPNAHFISVGTVAGHLLNSFALDISGNDLRVATTIRKRWVLRPMPLMLVVDEEPMDTSAFNDGIEEGTEAPSEELLEAESEVVPEVDQDVLSAIDVEVLPAIPSTLQVAMEESSTENYVIVLELESNVQGEMTERGRVSVGEKHEMITAVRFFDNVAYVVTFERTDPFYVIDLETPAVLGEFKLNGFSSYLHSMNEDNTLLIGVGQNATDEGRVTGLMITVFNVSIPETPVSLISQTVENDKNRYSSSAAEWEHKAFRYVDEKLIIPLNENYHMFDEEAGTIHYVSFRGFVVFNVTTTSIVESFRVSHHSRACHYCGGYLAPRSFVYDGNLMTVQDSVVASTNLYNGSRLWFIDLDIDGEQNNCCPYYLP